MYFQGDLMEVLKESEQILFQSLQNSGLDLSRDAFLAEFHARLEQYYTERESEFIEYTTAYILRNLLAELGYADLPDETLRRSLAEMYTLTQARWQPESDSLPVLHNLLERGYRLGAISNTSDDANVQFLIDKARLRPFFEIILTSAAVGIRKPNPRIFQIALDHWGSQPHQAVMVGDTLGADILGAANSGIRSIWITRRADTPANRAHRDTIRPDYTIQVLTELPGLLESINGSSSQAS